MEHGQKKREDQKRERKDRDRRKGRTEEIKNGGDSRTRRVGFQTKDATEHLKRMYPTLVMSKTAKETIKSSGGGSRVLVGKRGGFGAYFKGRSEKTHKRKKDANHKGFAFRKGRV